MRFIEGIALALVASSALAIEVPLTYVRHEDGEGRGFQPSGYAGCALKPSLPPGEWKVPELTGPRPLYGLVVMNGKVRALALGRQSADDPFYNRLYFDANGNNDLTDDPAVDGKLDINRQHDYCSVRFPPIDLEIPSGDRQTPFSLVASMTASRFSRLSEIREAELEHRFWLMLRANCHYAGSFELDGTTYRLGIADAECNGRFDKKLAHRKPSEQHGDMDVMEDNRTDVFYLSNRERLSPHESFNLGDFLMLEGKLFKVDLDIPGRMLTLAETSDGLAPLKLAAETEQLTLLGKGESRCVMAWRPGESVMVPADSYRLVAYRMVREDEQGDRWAMKAQANPMSPFVAAGGDDALVFGEPLKGVVTGSQRHESMSVRLGLSLRGAGGESIGEVVHISGSRTEIPLSARSRNYPKEASYHVAKPDGEVVARGTFEYG